MTHSIFLLGKYSWNEWLDFPLRISDLPRDAVLAITILDSYCPGEAVAVGATAISIYGKHSSSRQGLYDLRVWPDVEASATGDTFGKCDKNSTIYRLNKVASISPYSLYRFVKNFFAA